MLSLPCSPSPPSSSQNLHMFQLLITPSFLNEHSMFDISVEKGFRSWFQKIILSFGKGLQIKVRYKLS